MRIFVMNASISRLLLKWREVTAAILKNANCDTYIEIYVFSDS